MSAPRDRADIVPAGCRAGSWPEARSSWESAGTGVPSWNSSDQPVQPANFSLTCLCRSPMTGRTVSDDTNLSPPSLGAFSNVPDVVERPKVPEKRKKLRAINFCQCSWSDGADCIASSHVRSPNQVLATNQLLLANARVARRQKSPQFAESFRIRRHQRPRLAATSL